MSYLTDKVTEPSDTVSELVIVDGFDEEMQSCIDDYLSENPGQDIAKSQANWNSCLRYCYKRLLRPPYNLKDNRQCIINYKDLDSLNIVLDAYLDMCSKYKREVSVMGFHKLTGIATDTINLWKYGGTRNDSYINYKGNNVNDYGYSGEELKNGWKSIYKKITENHAESLRTRLYDSNNITGTMMLANHDLNYNQAGVKAESDEKHQARLTREALGIVNASESLEALLPKV